MSRSAPGRLELVQDFINTLDIEKGEDAIATAEGLEGWLSANHLLGADALPEGCDGRELETAIALREALRTLCLAHNGRQPDREARSALVAATDNLHLHLSARFGGDAVIELVPDETGARRGLAEILTIVLGAIQDGSWSRLKACASDTCQWAFYDHSRNHSGHWCSMSSCGNRAKVRSYRARQVPATSA